LPGRNSSQKEYRLRERLLQASEGFAGGFDLSVGGIEFEDGVILGDRFVVFIELERGLGEEEMSVGIAGVMLDGVPAALVGGVPVAAADVEAGYGDVFGLAVFVGLEIADLRESAAGSLLSVGGGGRSVGIGGRS
jgi:hypothetical protein